MGQAEVNRRIAALKLSFDFNAPKVHVLKSERLFLLRDVAEFDEDRQVEIVRIADAEHLAPRAVRRAMGELVGKKFPKGIAGRDAAMWADWLEVQYDDEESVVEVTWGMVEWLRALANDEDIAVVPGIAQWVQALAAYLNALERPALSAE